MAPPRPLLPLLAVLALLVGCPGDDGGDGEACTPDAEKRALADLVYDWYLYPETLPATVDTSQFATSAELLEYMTETWDPTLSAVARGWDRGWSFVTTPTAATTYFEEGRTVGFGIGLLVRGADVFVSSVYPDSPAAALGFARGDRILRIGESAAALVDVTPANLGALLGAAAEGVTRAIEVAPLGGAGPEVRTVTKAVFDLDPVPLVGGAQRWRIFERSGRKLGYVALRTFVATADPFLQEAFAAFKAAGVTDVAVDLRYNGGGLVTTGELLANLLGGRLAGQVMLRVTNNSAKVSYDETGWFGAAGTSPLADLANAIPATRLAFITTGASASASELVPNVLEPYKPGAIAFVGATTYGKPVGQRGFQFRGCETVVYLVSFRLENQQGDGRYFSGLPDADFAGSFCGAEDQLSANPGEEAEASTAAALYWLENGTCLSPPIAKPGAPGALKAAAPPDVYPEASDPSVAQRHVRGLF